MLMDGNRWVRVLAVSMLLAVSGCGGEKPAPAKTAGELSEEEKQQVRELNEQRTDEWGKPVKKK